MFSTWNVLRVGFVSSSYFLQQSYVYKVNNNFLFHIVLCPHYITKVIGLTSKVLSWLIEEEKKVSKLLKEWKSGLR